MTVLILVSLPNVRERVGCNSQRMSFSIAPVHAASDEATLLQQHRWPPRRPRQQRLRLGGSSISQSSGADYREQHAANHRLASCSVDELPPASLGELAQEPVSRLPVRLDLGEVCPNRGHMVALC